MRRKIKYIMFLIAMESIGCTNQVQESNIIKIESSSSISESSEITCPHCGNKKMETLPTDVCLIRYTCEKCNKELTPKEGDCCVFCTYGTYKCPSMQMY